MPRISSYPTITPTNNDLVLITDTSATGNPTKTATVASLNLNIETLQDVLDNNNTAIEDINLTGDIALTGNFTGTGNVTRTGNITLTGAQTISTTLGVTGLSTLASVDVNGGNIDGTIIGAAVAAAGTFTTLIGTNVDGIVGANTPAAGTFTTITGSGNMTIDTDTLFVNVTTNRVGIGTASPGVTLQIDSNAGEKGLSINAAQGQYAALLQSDSNTGDAYGLSIRAGTNKFDFPLAITNHDGSAPLFQVDGSGNVSIGTVTPNTGADLTCEGGAIALKETTTPLAVADYGKIYCKNDNKLYFQDGAGAEHEIQFV